MVIPAHPLALTARRRLDERRQRALTRYYIDAGAGGVAIGVHTTQFAIRDPNIGLFEPVLALGAEAVREWEIRVKRPIVRIAGIIGPTRQAVGEARLAHDLGYHAGLVSLGGLDRLSDAALLHHVRTVAEIIPIFGFYLQPAVGGRILSYRFWRALAELENLIAIKIAPFNRYQTLEVVRAVRDAGQGGRIALYTGNDDNIVADLLTPFGGGMRIVGGLLGHWAFWTSKAVSLYRQTRNASTDPRKLLRVGQAVTEVNAAVFDAANGFRGCLPGIHEMLRRQGLLAGRWCLDPREELSPGQRQAIDRVCRTYPHLADTDFVARHRDRWLS
jgi:dihydrodipicolinate synthase/N-acetylneuraminate lyase